MALAFVLKIVIFGYLAYLADNVETEECQVQTSLHQHNRQWMSTKTGYRQVVRDQSPAGPADVAVPGCAPVHLWTIVRHGTRYPSKKAIKLMTVDMPQLRDRILSSDNKLCQHDRDLLTNWNINVELDNSKNLHVEGDEEMILLGERWLNR